MRSCSRSRGDSHSDSRSRSQELSLAAGRAWLWSWAALVTAVSWSVMDPPGLMQHPYLVDQRLASAAIQAVLSQHLDGHLKCAIQDAPVDLHKCTRCLTTPGPAHGALTSAREAHDGKQGVQSMHAYTWQEAARTSPKAPLPSLAKVPSALRAMLIRSGVISQRLEAAKLGVRGVKVLPDPLPESLRPGGCSAPWQQSPSAPWHAAACQDAWLAQHSGTGEATLCVLLSESLNCTHACARRGC